MKRLNVLFSIRKLAKQLSYKKNEPFSFGNLDIISHGGMARWPEKTPEIRSIHEHK
jgi:hypothetical protein